MIIPLGNKRTLSAGIQFPELEPLRDVVNEYSTS